MSSSAVGVVAFAFVVGAVAAVRYPDTTERVLTWIDTGKNVLLGVITVTGIVVFIGSGSPALMLVGMLMLTGLVAFVVLENPVQWCRSACRRWLP